MAVSVGVVKVDDWVVAALRSWSRQWHAIDRGDASLPSVLGKLKSQREGAHSEGPARQTFPEVYRGDGLLVARSLHYAPGELREIAALHYLVAAPPAGPSARQKAEALGYSVRVYWGRVDGLHSYVAGWLARETVGNG